MKSLFRLLGAAIAVVLVLAAALALHTGWGKPLRFDWYLHRLLLRTVMADPEWLTSLRLLEPYGIKNHNGRLTDISVKQQESLAEQTRDELDTLHQYQRATLTPPRQISYDVVDWYLRMRVDGERWLWHDYPVNPLFGIQSELPTLMATQQQVQTERDARHYLRRLSRYDEKFSQLLEGLRLREERGVVPPAFAVRKVLEQMRGFTEMPADQNLLYTALRDKLAGSQVPEAQRAELLTQAAERIDTVVYPAYDQLIAYFERLQGKATADNGVWALPDGIDYYRWAVRAQTSTEASPEQLHQLGLAEVARIEAEMDAILRAQGLVDGSVGVRMNALGRDARFVYPNTDEGRAQCLADFQAIVDDASKRLEPYFGRRPRGGIEVRRVPAFKEKTSPQAYYDPPSLDGSRPGVFWVNLRDVGEIKKFGMRTLAYHEAIPGHHLQIAIAQELTDLPTLQKILPFTAYVEGWALYAERLASEMGLEPDPFDNLGRLRDEQFRAVRLVVDTGMHYGRWSREQAIAFMLDKTGMPEADVVAEIERYLVWPGQALAYKTGMLKILELRARAQAALGERFELRAFHDEVLSAGAMPLGVLEARIDRWIAARQK